MCWLNFQAVRKLKGKSMIFCMLDLCMRWSDNKNKKMQQYQWKGLKPQRFEGGRKHIKPADEIGPSLQPTLSNIGTYGIRTFGPKLSEEHVHKPIVKIFPDQFNPPQREIDPRGKKFVQLGEQKQRVRHEKAHVPGGYETTAELQNRGIKSFAISNALTQTEYNVESKLQKKARVMTYEDQRNGVGTSSLGDKAYKYPQYAPNFYHQGGLIPGSTFRPMPQKQKELQKNKKISVFTKPNWDVKVLMDQVAEQKRVVNAVDQWQQTILKQANPNWNDPDTFFQRMEAKKETKDVKKGGKK